MVCKWYVVILFPIVLKKITIDKMEFTFVMNYMHYSL